MFQYIDKYKVNLVKYDPQKLPDLSVQENLDKFLKKISIFKDSIVFVPDADDEIGLL